MDLKKWLHNVHLQIVNIFDKVYTLYNFNQRGNQ